jgi:hypothetical protein
MIGVGFGLLFLCAVGLINSWAWLIVLSATLFAYRFHAGWLFALGVCVDGYYGGFTQLPLYSLTFGGFAIMVEVLKLSLIGVKLQRD